MVKKKTVSAKIEPYAREATIQAGIDIILTAILLSFSVVLNLSPIICIAVPAAYIVFESVFYYRVLIQAYIDKHKGDFVTETVTIKRFSEERSLAGNSLGHSYIRNCYQKEKDVGKYKIKVVNNHGEEKKLRTVMSFRKILHFSILNDHQIEYLQITYLKRSKIIIWYDLLEETEKKLIGKKKKAIDKTMHFLNMSI